MSLGRPVGRRNTDSGCQWLVIGMSLGMGSALVFCLALYVVGIIEIRGLRANDPTPASVVIVSTAQVTATPQPLLPTNTPVIEASVAAPVATEDLQAAGSDTTVEQTSAQPTATLLGTGATPTRLPEVAVGTGGATPLAPVQAAAEIGTPVPLGGTATPVPSVGGDSGIPETLLAVGNPLADVPGGVFTMGTTREEGLAAVDACITRDGGACREEYIQDSTPAHQVTVDNFKMEIYEVSLNQYVTFLNYLLTSAPAGVRADLIGCGGKQCLAINPDEANSLIRFNGTEYELINPSFNANQPANFITWWGADAYCRALGRRLPTEAEWERAARGPANSIYPWGPEWVPENANTSRSTGAGTAPVAIDSYIQGISAYGLYNMAGNLAEWVADFYQENYYSLPESAGPNPRGPAAGSFKVTRGGAWDNVPLFARTVHRVAYEPIETSASVGFRCAADANYRP